MKATFLSNENNKNVSIGNRDLCIEEHPSRIKITDAKFYIWIFHSNYSHITAALEFDPSKSGLIHFGRLFSENLKSYQDFFYDFPKKIVHTGTFNP